MWPAKWEPQPCRIPVGVTQSCESQESGLTNRVLTIFLARSLIGGKEQQLVFLDGPAQSAAELILIEHRILHKEIVAVHDRAPEIFPGIPVKLVPAALGHNIHVCPAAAPTSSAVLP